MTKFTSTGGFILIRGITGISRTTKKIATKEQIRFVMLEYSFFQQQGNRRAVYERFVPELGIDLRVVEDRLDTGEWQILTAYKP